MTQDEIQRVFDEWVDRLNLGHYDLVLRFDLPVGEDNEAEIRLSEYYDQGSIRIGTDYPEWSAEWGEAVIVHELMHVFEGYVRRVVYAVLPTLSGAMQEVVSTWYQRESERMVEDLSQRFLRAAGKTIPPARLAKK